MDQRFFRNKKMVLPWRRIERVELIDADELARAGVRLVLLDRDNTLVPRDATVAPQSVLAWLEGLRAAGIATWMVSNNFHSSQVERSAEELSCRVVHHAMKPSPLALRLAMRLAGESPRSTVMIGDQLFTDVLASSFARVPCILVEPQCESDLWYTKLFRKVERPILERVPLEG